MMKMMNNMVDRLSKIENSQTIDKKVEDLVEEKVNQTLTEIQEKEKRKLNLVIVNLPENQGETIEETKKNDLGHLTDVLGEVVPEVKFNNELTNPTRLGPKNIGNRPRLLKITVKSEDIKKKILANASKLNSSNTDPKTKSMLIKTTQLKKENSTKF